MTRIYFAVLFVASASVGFADNEAPHIVVGSNECAINVSVEHFHQHIDAARFYAATCGGLS